jgi:hypothetical protein
MFSRARPPVSVCLSVCLPVCLCVCLCVCPSFLFFARPHPLLPPPHKHTHPSLFLTQKLIATVPPFFSLLIFFPQLIQERRIRLERYLNSLFSSPALVQRSDTFVFAPPPPPWRDETRNSRYFPFWRNATTTFELGRSWKIGNSIPFFFLSPPPTLASFSNVYTCIS